MYSRMAASGIATSPGPREHAMARSGSSRTSRERVERFAMYIGQDPQRDVGGTLIVIGAPVADRRHNRAHASGRDYIGAVSEPRGSVTVAAETAFRRRRARTPAALRSHAAYADRDTRCAGGGPRCRAHAQRGQ